MRFQVALFHSPKLKGILRTLLPARYNELIGLQHIKLYIIDDTVIMSGYDFVETSYTYLPTHFMVKLSFFLFRANLSHDYFTNRQDRYVLVKNCGQLADFFDGLIDILSDMSLQLHESNRTTFPKRSYHPYEGNSSLYISELKRRIESHYKSHLTSLTSSNVEGDFVFSNLYMKFFGYFRPELLFLIE